MKRFYVLLLPALFLTSIAFAQTNFLPGYVITLKGDTLKGQIDYKEWYYNPHQFSFKDNKENITVYTAANASACGINGMDHYKLATLSISMDQIDVSKIKNAYDPTVKTVTVFLRSLTEGKLLGLYSVTDELKTRYIIIDHKTGEVKELSHHFYQDQTRKSAVEITRYRIELTNYADTYQKNTSSLTSAIQRAGYNANDLSKIVNAINGEDRYKRTGDNARSHVRFFAGAALNNSEMTYRYDTDLAIDPKQHSDFFPQINFGVDYLVDPHVGRWILRGEVNLYAATMKAISANATKEVGSVTMNLHPQVIFNFYNTNSLKIFAGTGLLAHFSHYTKNSYVVTNRKASSTDSEAQPANVWLALPFKAGIVLNRSIEIYGAYNFPANIDENPFSHASGRVTSYQFGINYLFGKR